MSTQSQIADIFYQATGFANDASQALADVMNNLGDPPNEQSVPIYNAASIRPPEFDTEAQDFPDGYVPPDALEAFDAPQAPQAPTLPAVPTISTFIPVIGAVENIAVPSFSGVVPTVSIPNAPSAPAVNLPGAPTLITPVLPDAPEVNLPTFVGGEGPVVPDGESGAEQGYRDSYESSSVEAKALAGDVFADWITEYAPDLASGLSRLEAKIDSDIGGGQALSTEFEAALYERARSKVEEERRRVEADLIERSSVRGFAIPTGSMMQGLNAAQQQAASSLASQAVEIAIERAKMEFQHVQFVMNLSSSVRQILLNSATQYLGQVSTLHGQLLQHCKALADVMLRVYDQVVEKAKLEVEIYKAQALIFDTEMKAALAAVEIYKVEMEAVKVQSDVNEGLVDVYVAQIGAEESKVKMYTAEISAVAELARIEKYKVDIFAAEVQAYGAEMQGVAAKVQVSKAKVDADSARVSASAAVSKAEAARADAVAAGAKIQVEAYRAEIAVAVASSDAYRAKASGYSAQAQAASAAATAAAQAFGLTEQSRASANNAIALEYRAAMESRSSWIRAQANNVDNAIRANKANSDAHAAHAKMVSDTALSSGQIYAQMAGSALSGQNTMISTVEQK